jgi:hypothetical protein
VTAWIYGENTFDQYFDDLESFAWVLLWALIEIAKKNKVATPLDRAWMDDLNAGDLRSLEKGKKAIVSDLGDFSRNIAKGRPKKTSLPDPFIEILHHWFSLIEDQEDCGQAETLSPSKESTALYEAFITFAMEKMRNLPEEW